MRGLGIEGRDESSEQSSGVKHRQGALMAQGPASRPEGLVHTKQPQAEREYWLWMARSSALGAGEVSPHRGDSNAAQGHYSLAAGTSGMAQGEGESHLRFCGIGVFLRQEKEASDVVWRLDR